MSNVVLNVLSTNAIAGGGTEYQEIKSGVYRIICTAANQTVSINDGPAIQLIQNQPLLVRGGKPGKARVATATNTATAVLTLGQLGTYGSTHGFSVGDYIGVVDYSSNAAGTDWISATTAGKSISAATGNTITTNIDASGEASSLTVSSGYVEVVRCVKFTVGATNAIVVEEVQVA